MTRISAWRFCGFFNAGVAFADIRVATLLPAVTRSTLRSTLVGTSTIAAFEIRLLATFQRRFTAVIVSLANWFNVHTLATFAVTNFTTATIILGCAVDTFAKGTSWIV